MPQQSLSFCDAQDQCGNPLRRTRHHRPACWNGPDCRPALGGRSRGAGLPADSPPVPIGRFGVWFLAFFVGVALQGGSVCGAVAAVGGVASPAPTGWVTPKEFARLAPHPRLFVSAQQIERMVKGRGPAYQADYDAVAAAADAGVRDAEHPMTGESPFQRAFDMCGRLLALSVQWYRTHDRKYLDAAVENIQGMDTWLNPKGQIELWQGQDIAAIAMAYDLLYNDLSPQQRQILVRFARTHCADLFLRVTGDRRNPMVEGEHGSWWQGIISNWNPVCTSGAGMLALTMYEDLPDAQTIIDRVQKSYQPILDDLQKTHGGWGEGLGYWNWTMHYLSLFMISYERATGKEYPGFHSEGFKQTLLFGLHFVPYDEACGFGDNQHGHFSPSLLEAAQFLNYPHVLQQLQDCEARYARIHALKQRLLEAATSRPALRPAEAAPRKVVRIGYDQPLRLLINPDPLTGVPAITPQKDLVHIYPLQGWGMIADRWPAPHLYASFRGGVDGGPHTHADMLSWNGVVGIERMILDYHQAGYYSPSFDGRAREIYERSPAAKNTLFIAGLSAYIDQPRSRSGPATARETQFVLPTGPAARLDATRAFYLGSGNPHLVCRVFTLLGDKGILVLDRVEMPAANPVEVRTHTEKRAEFGKSDVLLQGQFETARITFAADHPAVLHRAADLLTDARAVSPTMMRWQTLGSVRDVTMASLLTPGSDPVDLTVRTDDKLVTVIAVGKGWRKELQLTRRLEPLAPGVETGPRAAP